MLHLHAQLLLPLQVVLARLHNHVYSRLLSYIVCHLFILVNVARSTALTYYCGSHLLILVSILLIRAVYRKLFILQVILILSIINGIRVIHWLNLLGMILSCNCICWLLHLSLVIIDNLDMRWYSLIILCLFINLLFVLLLQLLLRLIFVYFQFWIYIS